MTQAGQRFLAVGGDHSCAIGTWTGAAESLRGALGLIWIDAHMDMHVPATLAKSQMSIISCTSPRPSDAILPGSIATKSAELVFDDAQLRAERSDRLAAAVAAIFCDSAT